MWDNIVFSVFIQLLYYFCNLLCFPFLYAPFVFLAHPLRYLHKDLILFCQIYIRVEPLFSLSNNFVTISYKPSLNNQLRSNLNKCEFCCDGILVFNSRGVWSEISLVRVQTVTLGYFSSYSIVTKILSNFS
jgi:hypothetical protein